MHTIELNFNVNNDHEIIIPQIFFALAGIVTVIGKTL